MRTRRFGRTGIEVSELVFGGGWVGGILIDASDEVRREVMRRALAAGVNWVDTAAMYGQGRSEEALAWLLPEQDVQPYLSTKVQVPIEGMDDLAGSVQRGVEASLERLQRDSVDLIQLHNPIVPERVGDRVSPADVLGRGGIADALERVREQGLARFIGITALGERGSLIEVIDSGRFDTAQVYYNALNPTSAWEAPREGWADHDFSGVLAACRRQDMGTMGIRVYAAGVLATEVRTGREVPMTDSFDLAAEEANAAAVRMLLGDAHGTPAQAAVRYALANDALSCVVFGLATLSHLDEALEAAEMGPLPPDVCESLGELQTTGFRAHRP